MDGARPRSHGRNFQPVQPDISMMSLLDVDGQDGVAIPVCGRGVELTRAAIGAIAVYEFTPFDSSTSRPANQPPDGGGSTSEAVSVSRIKNSRTMLLEVEAAFGRSPPATWDRYVRNES